MLCKKAERFGEVWNILFMAPRINLEFCARTGPAQAVKNRPGIDYTASSL